MSLISVSLQLQEGWCDSRGTLEDVKAKIQMRQEGAFKRERAIAYSLAQKVTSKVETFWTFPFPFCSREIFPKILDVCSNAGQPQVPFHKQMPRFPLSRITRLAKPMGDGVGWNDGWQPSHGRVD